MKTLVLPDIHTNYRIPDYIINKYNCDRVIMLGDIFDQFGDTPKSNGETAKWLKEFIPDDRFIILLGNHEFNYYCNKTLYQCSGYSRNKRDIINNILSPNDWRSMHCFHLDNTTRTLYTHAGATAQRFKHPMTGEFMVDKLKSDYQHVLLIDWDKEIGMARGGHNLYGGIFWCDFNAEYMPIKGIRQIFGHTPGDKIGIIEDNICLDIKSHDILKGNYGQYIYKDLRKYHFMIIEDRVDSFYEVNWEDNYKNITVKEIQT